MIEIDGSSYSGSGTLLRYAACLATLTGEPLHMTRIRSKRPKPGLRAQHLSAVSACAQLSGGSLEGGEVGAQELIYRPGVSLHGGRFHFDIGTAGSATMAAFTLIPPALFASSPSSFTITGGLFQDFAPTFYHMQRVLVPLLRAMGAVVEIHMVRPGYVPEGGGILTLSVTPLDHLKPLRLIRQGSVKTVSGIAISSHLKEQSVSRRMAERCTRRLSRRGIASKIEVVDDSSAVQKGAALVLWTATDTGSLLGSDRAGRPGRRSEAIAEFVVRSLLEDLETGACTDRYVADQLILFGALAQGTTEYRIPMMTDHVEANLWLVEKILGARSRMEGKVLTIEGVGMTMQ